MKYEESIVYIDSSAALRWIFKSENYFEDFGGWRSAGSSVLLEIECHRVIDRLRLQNEISDDDVPMAKSQLEHLLAAISLISINSEVVAIARAAFPVPVRSLDAIHLATAILWSQEEKHDISLLSHDKQMNRAARTLGIECVLN